MARLLLAVFLLLELRAAKTSAQVCGEKLDGYDYMALTEQSSWIFQVQPGDCEQIFGAPTLDCQVEFAICRDLSLDACSKPSAVCLSITTDTEPNFFTYSLGQSNASASEPIPPGPGAPEGFGYSFSKGDNTSSCNTSTEIIMLFQCDESASWDYKNPAHNNVTQFVASFDATEGCVISVIFNYSGACLQDFPTESYNCDLPGYDLATLANSSTIPWFATPPPGNCYFPDGFTPIGGSPCTLYFSFCQPLSAASCYDSVFCEVMDPAEPIASLSFGSYYPNITLQTPEDFEGFILEYEGGSTTTNCPGGLMGTVSFVCNQSAVWTDLINGDVTEYMVAGDDEELCQYVITFQYSGACSTSTKSSVVSFIGWVLMAVVIGIALIYFVTGLVVQYVRGRRGVELIPNVEFWKLFFLLCLEGCQFTLNIVTCYQLRPAMPKSVSKMDYEAL